MQRILVTGGAGFIGSHLTERLLQGGYGVTVLDDLSSGSMANLSACLGKPDFSFKRAGLDSQELQDLVSKSDAVIHLAAKTSVILSKETPLETNRSNVDGTLNLLEACRKADVERFVLASSAAVYGVPSRLPVDEEERLNPLSPYAASKVACEAYCRAYFESLGLHSVVLRFFNVYGPRRAGGEYAGAITKFATAIHHHRPVTIYGDGYQTRDFVNVLDLADGIVEALTMKLDGFETVNLGTGHPTTILDLVRAVGKAMGQPSPEMVFQDKREGEIRNSYSATVKSLSLLRFRPKISLDDGIRAYCDWFVKNEAVSQ